MAFETITVVDGGNRSLAVSMAGPGDGFPILVHSGSPGSRVLSGSHVELAVASGFRLISYDRPGYGLSSPRPGRTVADAAGDGVAIAGALGLDRFATWGFSGGGPFALACAALLPGQVIAACVFASLGPSDAPDLDFACGRSGGFQAEVDLFFNDRYAARRKFREDAAQQLREMCDPGSWMRGWGDRADADSGHSQALAEQLAAQIVEAARQGDEGWWEDWAAYLSPWGFDLQEIGCPVQLWYGERDVAVPIVHGKWIAEHVIGVESHFLTGEDHSTIEANHQADAIAWIDRVLAARR